MSLPPSHRGGSARCRLVVALSIVGVLAVTAVAVVRPPAAPAAAAQSWAAPMVSATPSPLPSAVDPTPYGRPILVGTPMPPPALAADAIRPGNADCLAVIARLAPPPGGEAADERALAFSRDGKRLYSAHFADLVTRQTTDGRTIDSLPALPRYDRGEPKAFSLDDRYLIGPSPDVGGYVDIWDLTARERVRQHRGGDTLVTMALDHDGQLLAAGRRDGRISVWELANGSLLSHFLGGETASGYFAFHPARDELATADGPGPGVQLRDPRTAAVSQVLAGPVLPDSYASLVAYRPDGEVLAAVRTAGRPDYRHDGPADVVLWQDG